MGKLAKSEIGRDRGSDDPDAGSLLPTRCNFGSLGFNLLLVLDRFPPLPDYLLLGPVYQLLVGATKDVLLVLGESKLLLGESWSSGHEEESEGFAE